MTTNITMPPLPAISEDTFESSIPISQPLDVPSLSLSLFPHDSPVTEKELSSLSPTQVKEILQLVTFHLKKNGRITPDLLHLLLHPIIQHSYLLTRCQIQHQITCVIQYNSYLGILVFVCL
jgi:hypothetical protein